MTENAGMKSQPRRTRSGLARRFVGLAMASLLAPLLASIMTMTFVISTSHGGWGPLEFIFFALVVVFGPVFGCMPSAIFLAPALLAGERFGNRRLSYIIAGGVAGLAHFAASAAFLATFWGAPWEWQRQLKLVGLVGGFSLATMARQNPTLGLVVATASVVAGCAAGMTYALIALSGPRGPGESGPRTAIAEPGN